MSFIRVENKDEMEAFYRRSLPIAKQAAKDHGYAIGVHGSLRRDLDLIAVPWVEIHSDKNVLAEAIQKAICGFTMQKYEWEEKPNGRMATAFPICTINHNNFDLTELSLGHLDLSVVGSSVKTQRSGE